MSLTVGSRLGSHEILGLLGAGGMGEVFLAEDTRLKRRVAIKVLPAAAASDPDRVARFHREAQALAALNHPGIAAIYDLAESNGTTFLVLELIDGETLAERLRRGPPAVDEALRIARQMLDALAAAHERGIGHRDLKPANVSVTRDGTVKILDFGLATFRFTGAAAAGRTDSTLTFDGTSPGVILGTAGYMSPEQAKGLDADHRSDIFSFGCIFYELLSGRRAFAADTASESLANVLKSDVDLAALPPDLNPRLVEMLRRCLEKDPRQRWHAAADVRLQIDDINNAASVMVEQRLPCLRDRSGRRRRSREPSPYCARLAWAIRVATEAGAVTRGDAILNPVTGGPAVLACRPLCAGAVARRLQSRLRRQPPSLSAADVRPRVARDRRQRGA